jgi:Spy/CpxP family protein refolding chaperone
MLASVALGADGDARQARPADADGKRKRLEAAQFGRFGQPQPLLPSGAADKLKLTAEQKDKVAQLEKEFETKQKEIGGKLREEIQKAIQNKDREAVKNAFTQMREVREKEEKLREEYQDKVAALLTADQKKTFEEVKKEQPGRRPFGGQFPPFGRPGAGQAPGKVLPDAVQEKLGLSADQKDKISRLQKELEDKIMEVLTPDQKKKLEELKKEQGGRPPFRRPRGTDTN